MSDCAHVSVDELDALIRAELTLEPGAAIQKHAAGCPACSRELDWLRAEQRMLTRRRSGESRRRDGRADDGVVSLDAHRATAAGFREVQARVARMRARDRAAARRSVLLAALSAAAILLVALRSGSPRSPVEVGAQLFSAAAVPWCLAPADAVASLESAFSACLSATPSSLPGAGGVCL